MRIFERTIELPGWDTEFRLIPFGCVHADTDGFNEALFHECIEDIKKPHTYAIGAGDYLDALRTHARKALAHYRADEQDQFTETDKLHRAAYTDFYRKYLKPIQDKIFFLGQGNHYWQFASGQTSDMLLSELCKCPYGDKPTFFMLKVKIHGKIVKRFKILVHHEGGGGSGYARHGTDVNAAETKLYQFGDFDIVIFSHTHRKWGLLIPDLYLSDTGELRVWERTRALIRTGCFTGSYHNTCLQHYAHKKLLPPTELGYVTLKIKMRKEYDPVQYAARRAAGQSVQEARVSQTETRYRMKLEL